MKRNHEIKIKISKEELEVIQKRAAKLSLPVSTYCRLIVISTEPLEE